MAFTKFTDPADNITNQPNQPIISATALKALFDETGKDAKDYINNVLTAELESTTNGDSGADNIGHNSANILANTVGSAIEEVAIKAKGTKPTTNIYSVLDYGLVGNGVANDATALNTLIANIGNVDSTILFPSLMTSNALYLISTNVVFPSNINVVFNEGATLKISNTFTVTGTNTKLTAGIYKIFDLSLGGTIIGEWILEKVYPQWFGSFGGGVNDDTQEVKKAVSFLENLTSGTLFFPFVIGGYYFNESIISTGSNIIFDFNKNTVKPDPTGTYSADGGFIKFDGSTNSHIKNIKLSWATNVADGSPSRPLLLDTCERCSVSYCEVTNAKDNAIWITKGDNNEIHHNYIKSPAFHGIASTADGGAINAPEKTYVYNNVIEDVADGLTALNVHSTATGRTFYYDNIMYNCGMVCKNESGPYTAKRNVFYSGDTTGVNSAFLVYEDNTIIEDNEIYECPSALRVLGAKNTSFSKNNIINNTVSVNVLISIDSNTENLDVTENKIYVLGVINGGKLVDSVGTTGTKKINISRNTIDVLNVVQNNTPIYLDSSDRVTFNNNNITYIPDIVATAINGVLIIASNSQCIANNIEAKNAGATVYRCLYLTGSNGIATNNVIIGNLRIKLADSIIQDNNKYTTLTTT